LTKIDRVVPSRLRNIYAGMNICGVTQEILRIFWRCAAHRPEKSNRRGYIMALGGHIRLSINSIQNNSVPHHFLARVSCINLGYRQMILFQPRNVLLKRAVHRISASHCSHGAALIVGHADTVASIRFCFIKCFVGTFYPSGRSLSWS